MEFVSLIFYIIYASLIWQTIVAVKRHTKRWLGITSLCAGRLVAVIGTKRTARLYRNLLSSMSD